MAWQRDVPACVASGHKWHPTPGSLGPVSSFVPSFQLRGFGVSHIRIGFAVHFGEQINLFLYLTVVKSWDFESL